MRSIVNPVESDLESGRAVPGRLLGAARRTPASRRGIDRPSRPLEGESLTTTHSADAYHWISIYADLVRFKLGLLARVERDIARLQPIARRAAAVDLTIIRNQMSGYETRLDLWYRRLWELQGLVLDPQGRMIRHQGRDASLTRREYQLLQFLLDHPHRYYSVTQIMCQAWAEPSLFPEEVRNYVHRVRKILSRLQIPVALVNRPRRGYSLEFQTDAAGPVEVSDRPFGP